MTALQKTKTSGTPASTYRLVVWHPAIHWLYAENLHYFLLKIRAFSNDTITEIDKLLHESGASGRCLYQVYGTYDFMIRVWLNQNKRSALISRIMQSEHIHNADEFIADTTAIDFFPIRPIDRETIQRLATQHYTPEKLRRAQNGDAELLKQLKKQGLVIKHTTIRKRSGIKFFWLLRCAPDRKTSLGDSLEQYLVEHASAKDDLIEDLSMYRGNGFANFIVKGIASDFFAIGSFVNSFLASHSKLNVESETMLVTRQDFGESECDNIDFNTTLSTWQQLQIEQAIGLNEYELRELVNMAKEDKDVFVEQFEKAFDAGLFPLDREQILTQVFKAYLAKNNSHLMSALALLFINLESNLRPFLVMTAQELFGQDWQKTKMSEIMNAAKLAAGKTVSSFTMGDYVAFLGHLDKHHNAIITTKLGPNWEKALRESIKQRNDLLHGKIDQPVEDWKQSVAMATALLPIYQAMRGNVEATALDMRGAS